MPCLRVREGFLLENLLVTATWVGKCAAWMGDEVGEYIIFRSLEPPLPLDRQPLKAVTVLQDFHPKP